MGFVDALAEPGRGCGADGAADSQCAPAVEVGFGNQ